MHIFRRKLYLLLQGAINRLFLARTSQLPPPSDECALVLFTITSNSPLVLELQAQLLKQFCKNYYTQIVCDNSTNIVHRNSIRSICSRYDIQFIALPPNPWSGIHPSMSHGLALNWLVRHVAPLFPAHTYGFLDHDIFPIQEFSIVKTLGTHSFYGIPQVRKHLFYLWPGFLFIQSRVLRETTLNFCPNRHGDTGVEIHKIIERYPDETLLASHTDVLDESRPQYGIQRPLCTKHDDAWIHIGNASGWRPKDISYLSILELVRC